MIKVTINGLEFECDSAKDAAELAKLMAAEDGAPNASVKSPAEDWPTIQPQQLSSRTEVISRGSSLPPNLKEFISNLSSVAGKEIDGEELSESLYLRSSRGLGPRLGSLRREFETAGVDFDDLLRRASDQPREKMWRVATKDEIARALKGS